MPSVPNGVNYFFRYESAPGFVGEMSQDPGKRFTRRRTAGERGARPGDASLERGAPKLGKAAKWPTKGFVVAFQ